MNNRNIINDYAECNNFEIKYLKDKLYIYYYSEIKDFSSKKITITHDTKTLIINGNNLVIETMFKEYLIIKGIINYLEFKYE